MQITRRSFIASSTATVALATAGVFVYTFKIGPHHLNIVHRNMRLPNLPSALKGKRLIHISDLHIGPSVDDAYMIEALEQVNDLKPDILCVTGDFMTSQHGEEVDHACEIISHLNPAEMATVGIFGNHDYAHRWNNKQVANDLASGLRNTNITLLRNESLDLDGLQIFGLDDLWAKAFHPETGLKDINPAHAHLALSHNPDTVDMHGWDHFAGTILAGHTHGGQCKPPFLAPPMLPVENKRYTQGMFDLGDHRRTLHINPGLGHLLNVRFGTRPEITVFTLS